MSNIEAVGDKVDLDFILEKIIPSDSPLSATVKSHVLHLMSLSNVFLEEVADHNTYNSFDKLSNSDCQMIIDEIRAQKQTEAWAISYMMAVYTQQFRDKPFTHKSWQFMSVYLQLMICIAKREDKHFKRINQLGVRVRMALGINSAQYAILESLHEIHAKYKNADDNLNAIREDEESLKNKEATGEVKILNLAQKLGQIRLAYEVVIENKEAITRKRVASTKATSIGKLSKYNQQLPDVDIPTRKLRFTERYDDYSHNNVAEAENIADDDPISLLDNDYKPPKIVAKSSQLQQYQVKVNYLHSRRNQFLLPSSTRVLDLYSFQNIFKNLWQQLLSSTLLRERQTIAVILLSLLTGRSINTITTEVSINKSERHLLIEESAGMTVIVNHIDVSPNRINKIKARVRSHGDSFKLPLPNELQAVLMNKFTVDANDIDTWLKNIKTELELPSLSRQHIESALIFIITHILGQRLHAEILTGVSVQHSAPLYYTSISTAALIQTYQSAINKISTKVYKLLINHRFQTIENKFSLTSLNAKSHSHWQAYKEPYFINMPSIESNENQQYIGSQSALEDDVCQQFFEQLAKTIENYNGNLYRNFKNNTDTYIEQFNYYSLWLWEIIQIQTGIRPVNDAPGLLNQFDFDQGLYWVSDKAMRQNSYQGRLIPISDFLKTALQRYIGFLKQFASIHNPLYPQHQLAIEDILESKLPFLQIFSFNPKGFIAISPSRIRNLLGNFLPQKDNWLRHQLRAMLTDRVAELYIRALFGHEHVDQEILHPMSSLPLSDYKKLATDLDDIASRLALRKVEVKLYG